jgi:hypothetical protein
MGGSHSLHRIFEPMIVSANNFTLPLSRDEADAFQLHFSPFDTAFRVSPMIPFIDYDDAMWENLFAALDGRTALGLAEVDSKLDGILKRESFARQPEGQHLLFTAGQQRVELVCLLTRRADVVVNRVRVILDGVVWAEPTIGGADASPTFNGIMLRTDARATEAAESGVRYFCRGNGWLAIARNLHVENAVEFTLPDGRKFRTDRTGRCFVDEQGNRYDGCVNSRDVGRLSVMGNRNGRDE